MNCREARELFDLRLDEALERTAARVLDDHLSGCPSCSVQYERLKAESRVLKEAMQALLCSPAEISRIEERVQGRTISAPTRFAAGRELIVPAVGSLLGMVLLAAGQFDGVGVREAILETLSPKGGFSVSIASLLVAVSCVLFVLVMIQPFMLDRRQSSEQGSRQ